MRAGSRPFVSGRARELEPGAGAGRPKFVDAIYAVSAGLIAGLMLVQITGSVGTILVGVQIVLALLMFALAPGDTARLALTWWPLLLLPLFACASFLWSGDPMVSLRYGVQFFLTAFIGLFIASQIAPERLAVILFWAALIFLLASIASGRQGVSMQGYVLIGLAGSKNQIGNAAQFSLLLSLVLLVMPSARPIERLAALAALPLGAWVLYQSNATTPLVLALVGFAILGLGLVMLRAAPAGRVAVLAGALGLSAPLLILAPEIDAWVQDFMLNVLGKDPTLTGRTLLWDKANELIAQRPWLGHGYQSLWVGESPEAVGLRLWTGMADGRTFHFHNSFLQYAADLGYVGAALFIATVLGALAGWIGGFLRGLDIPRTGFLALFVTLIARMPTEVVLGAFSFTSLLFFICLRMAFDRNAAKAIDRV